MKVSFGRYLPLNSIIHRVDPRIKLLVLICLIASLFFILVLKVTLLLVLLL